MPLVDDILSSAKNKEGLSTSSIQEMEKLLTQSEEARVSVSHALNTHYMELSSSLNCTLMLQDQLNSCIQEVLKLDAHIKDDVIPSVEGSASEIARVSLRWNEMKKELEATQILLDIHTLLEESQSAYLSKDFNTAVEQLNKIEDLLDEASTKEVVSQLKIISSLKDELAMRRANLIHEISEAWNKFVSFSEDIHHNGSRNIWLLVQDIETEDEQKEKSARNLFSVLNSLGELLQCIRSFAKHVLRHFIKPIICEGGELGTFHQNESGASGQSGVCVKKRTDEQVKSVGSAVEALNSLEMLLTFIHGHFYHYPIEENGKERPLMSLLGTEIEEEFIELVLSNCLEESVPSDRKNLEGFSEVQLRVEMFHKFLVKIEFYPQDHTTLLNYVSNVETVYGNKTCASILMRARSFIMKPLDVTASIRPLSPQCPLAAVDNFGHKLKETTKRLQNLSPKTFNLPECKVSVSVCELVNLIYNTLDEACESAPEFGGRLFHTVRNILSMYCHVTPMAHAKTLATCPQHAAIVHNNGLFVSHHALLLGHHYRNRFPSELRDSTLSTVDLGYLIRTSGCEVFLKAMKNHKNSLMETLKKGIEYSLSQSDFTSLSSLHTSVQDCVHYLQTLRDAWRPILPRSVYEKSIGTLAGSVVEDLILRITSLEEISAEDAIGLMNVLSLLSDGIPTLFSENEALATVLSEVRQWEKMNELSAVLAASLKELDERWAEGKGPLAVHFTPGEVKHLIKAIFQNTERRAKLLARIK